VADEQSSAEKTEAPSQRKLRDARKQGNLPKSKDAATAVILAGMGALAYLGVPAAADKIGALFLLSVEQLPRGHEGQLWILSEHITAAAVLIATVLGIAGVLAILAMLAQTGFSVSMEPVKPKLSRVNPAEGLKRLFKWRKLVEVAKSVLILVVILCVVFVLLRRRVGDLVQLPMAHGGAVLDLGIGMGLGLLTSILAIVAIVGALDVIFQRFVWLQDQRMTRQEARREQRDSEGEPALKSRRRRVARELMDAPDIERLAQATLVLSGGATQVVAMQYVPELGSELPLVLFKAQGSMAEEALSLAAQRGVRIVHDDALTADLFPIAKPLQYIPAKVADEVGRLFRD